MTFNYMAVSNHGDMVGGGEYAFIDVLKTTPYPYRPIAILPKEGELYNRLKDNRIKAEAVPLPRICIKNLLKIIKAVMQLYKIAKVEKADFIYANGSRAAIYSALVGFCYIIPVIWHCRVAESDRKLDFFLCRSVTKIIANSYATAKRFKRKFLGKVNVVHNGIDLSAYRNYSPLENKILPFEWEVILVVARVSKWKRHDLVIDAFERIAEDNPKCHLFCIGQKDNYERFWWEKLQNRSQKSEFSSRIHWLGKIDNVVPWYKRARLLILSSDNEPFGRVIVEAMASGLPVIATNGGGVPEIISNGESGILVKPNDSIAISRAIVKLLNDIDLNNKIIINGIERSKQFSLDNHIKNLFNVFNEVVKNSKNY
jgi:glycosyltransferase involved in cell wall biosynthesis